METEKPKSNLKSFEVKGKTYELKNVTGFWYLDMKRSCTDMLTGTFDVNAYQNKLLDGVLNDYLCLDDFNASEYKKTVTLECGKQIDIQLMSVQEWNNLLLKNGTKNEVSLEHDIIEKCVKNVSKEELNAMPCGDIYELYEQIMDFLEESPIDEVQNIIDRIESFLGVGKEKQLSLIKKAQAKRNFKE